MIPEIMEGIIGLIIYGLVGFGALAYYIHNPIGGRWKRFLAGLIAIIYGTNGVLVGRVLIDIVKDAISVRGWKESVTPMLITVVSSVEWSCLVLQFCFAAVGAGLIVNAITTERPLSQSREEKRK